MGVGQTKLVRRKESKVMEVTKEEREKARVDKRLVNLILLGSGESGKSTILKQMKLLHGGGFSQMYKEQIKPEVLFNIIEGAVAVLDSMTTKGRKISQTGAADVVLAAYKSRTSSEVTTIDEKTANAVMALIRNDEGFLTTIQEGDSHQLQDGWLTLAEKLERYPDWGGKDWIPDASDILATRVRTTGVTSHDFKIDKIVYSMVDVGGQRGERRKYLDIFTEMQGVLFVFSMGEYNLNLFESPTESRIEDSLQLWETIANSVTFQNSALLLFLNKFDVFQEKYYKEKIPLPTIEGFKPPPKAEDEVNDKCDKGVEWFESLLLDRVSESKKMSIFTHVTTALNTPSMEVVMKDVASHMVTQLLGGYGMTSA